MEKFNSKLYEVLGRLEHNATAKEIKEAYRYYAKIYHPDKNTDKVYAGVMMTKLNEAYEILSNSEKRAEYNKKLKSYHQKLKIAEEQKRKAEEFKFKKEKTHSNSGLASLVGVGLGVLAFGLILDAFSNNRN